MGMARGETSRDRDTHGVRGEPVASLATSASMAYDEHGESLRAYLSRYTGDAASAEDLVHEAFVRLLTTHGFSGAEIARRIGRTELTTRSMVCRHWGRLWATVAA